MASSHSTRWPKEQLAEAVGGSAVCLGDGLGVEAKRESNVRMTKAGLRSLHVDTLTNEKLGAVVFLDMMDQLYYETDFTHEHRRADRLSPIQ